MKIYTKTGDDGTTGLFGGPRVPKDHIRIEAYGTVDELNSQLGVVRASISLNKGWSYSTAEQTSEGAPSAGASETPSTEEILTKWITRVQSELFDLGADLATPSDAKVRIARFPEAAILRLEEEIDAFDEEVEPLKSFILPGGHELAAHLHLARSMCRRAERRVISLAEKEPINSFCTIYLNRLSDALFTAARWVNHQYRVPEPKWKATESN